MAKQQDKRKVGLKPGTRAPISGEYRLPGPRSGRADVTVVRGIPLSPQAEKSNVSRPAGVSERYVVGDQRRVEELRTSRQWFADNKNRVFRKYPNQYVAIVGKRIVDHDTNLETLTRRLYERSERAIFMPFTGNDEPQTIAANRSPKVAEA
jgi:hypothetical protein